MRENSWGEDDPKFDGELEAIYIYPNRKRFSPENRIECSVRKIADSLEIDLASLQSLTHTLPPNVSIVPLAKTETDETKIQVGTRAFENSFLMVMGYW